MLMLVLKQGLSPFTSSEFNNHEKRKSQLSSISEKLDGPVPGFPSHPHWPFSPGSPCGPLSPCGPCSPFLPERQIS